MRPLIGMAMCLDDRGRWHPKRQTLHLDNAYARAVAGCGGVAVCLPVQEDAESLASRVDGLLLPGGGDFVPDRSRSYPPEVCFASLSAEQLDFERRLLELALERGMPVLGICYGMQLMALRRGGSLHYDIATDVPEAGLHALPEPDGRHGLAIEPGTRLARILGDAPGSVNSRHHQAVSDTGDGLRVSARAADGLVEAIEEETGPFHVGVQWHPEDLDGAHRERLFGAFVAACAAGRGSSAKTRRGTRRSDAPE